MTAPWAGGGARWPVPDALIGQSGSRCARSCQCDAAPLFPEQPEGGFCSLKALLCASSVPVSPALSGSPVCRLLKVSRRWRISAEEEDRDMV